MTGCQAPPAPLGHSEKAGTRHGLLESLCYISLGTWLDVDIRLFVVEVSLTRSTRGVGSVDFVELREGMGLAV